MYLSMCGRLVLAAVAMVAASDEFPSLVPMPGIPDARGRAGMFAGVHAGVLVAAGGANFPQRMPWDGGTKVWYDEAFALRPEDSTWRSIGRLPAANAYGVSLTATEGVLIIGGGDGSRHFADVWLMSAGGGTAAFRALPPLPVPLAQMAGAIVGRDVHIVGGIERPDATAASEAHFVLGLDEVGAGWRRLAAPPAGGRILATAAALNGALYVLGGCSLRPGADGRPTRTYHRDAWRFARGAWTRLPDLPAPVAAAPSPAPVFGAGLYVVSGDDGHQVNVKPSAHTGFTRRILRYDATAGRWDTAGEVPHAPAVTLPTAPWQGGFALVSGEVQPGVRTPRVSLFRPAD